MCGGARLRSRTRLCQRGTGFSAGIAVGFSCLIPRQTRKVGLSRETKSNPPRTFLTGIWSRSSRRSIIENRCGTVISPPMHTVAPSWIVSNLPVLNTGVVGPYTRSADWTSVGNFPGI
jgi:hypothetical protein